MTVLACGANPVDVDSALRGALLTDDELAAPQDWSGYPDPFGDWHEDPCGEAAEGATTTGLATGRTEEGDR